MSSQERIAAALERIAAALEAPKLPPIKASKGHILVVNGREFLSLGGFKEFVQKLGKKPRDAVLAWHPIIRELCFAKDIQGHVLDAQGQVVADDALQRAFEAESDSWFVSRELLQATAEAAAQAPRRQRPHNYGEKAQELFEAWLAE